MMMSVSKKIILMFTFMLIVMGLALCVYLLSQEKQTLLLEFDRRAKVLLSSLAVSSEYPVLAGDEKMLARIGEGALRQRDVIYCEIRNEQDKVLFQGGKKQQGDIREHHGPIISSKMVNSTRETLILAPERQEPKMIGTVHLVLSLSSVMKRISEAKHATALLIAAGVAVASVLISLLTRFVLGRPVAELTRGIERVASGDFHYEVPVRTKDEIGVLAASFNKMAAHLRDTTASIADLNKEIAERHRAEKALRENEQKLQGILSAVTDHMTMMDEEYNIVWANDVAHRLFGSDLIGKKCYEVFHKRKEACQVCVVTKCFADGRVHEHEIELVGDNEKTLLLWCTASVAARYDNGRPKQVIETCRDMTDRRRADEALRASEAKYRTLVENLPQRVFLKDTDCVYVSCNQSYANDLGISPDEIAGRTDYDFHPPELADKYTADDRRIIQSARTGRIEERYIAEGREVIVQTVKTPVKDQAGNVTGVLGIFWDITQQKRAEEELKRTAEELARSNRELEQFAYVASHDLQEPLRIVGSFTELLAKRYQGKLDDEAREFISFIVDGTTRMQALIRDLLAYSRVGTHGKPFKRADCEAVFERAVSSLQILIGENGAVVTHDRLPTVMADELQLGQLFQNLIANAVKYHREEPPRVHVSAGRNGNECLFAVRDNGIGIDPEHLQRIFLIFQRLHSDAECPGTGIGLAICKKIVERHGGRIWVESQPGKGSTFFFTIPDTGGN
jgi:PAS domain S-box-containing protein